jgi:hypothetical protein
VWRCCISSVFARRNAFGSIAAAVASWNCLYSRRCPNRKRDSSIAVCTVTSASASATHSSTVRTLEPISRPMSQQAVMKPATPALSASCIAPASSPGSSTSTSMSE